MTATTKTCAPSYKRLRCDSVTRGWAVAGSVKDSMQELIVHASPARPPGPPRHPAGTHRATLSVTHSVASLRCTLQVACAPALQAECTLAVTVDSHDLARAIKAQVSCPVLCCGGTLVAARRLPACTKRGLAHARLLHCRSTSLPRTAPSGHMWWADCVRGHARPSMQTPTSGRVPPLVAAGPQHRTARCRGCPGGPG